MYGPVFNELIEFEAVSWDSANFILSMEIFEDILIPGDTEYIILIDTIFFDPSDNGIIRGNTGIGSAPVPIANLYKFKMEIYDDAGTPNLLEIKISDFVNYPPESPHAANQMNMFTY